MICIASLLVANGLLSTASPIYPTLFRGETPVHYFPPAEKLPSEVEPFPTFPQSPSYQYGTQYTPSPSFGPYSIHQYEPSYKSTSVDSNTPIHQNSGPYQYQHNLAYQPYNVFQSAPPYQSNFNSATHESSSNYQQDYTGFGGYSWINLPQK